MGRKKRVDRSKFDEFLDSVPEVFKAAGYWRLCREYQNPRSGGVLRSYIGHIPFEEGEDYDDLKKRVKEVAENKGPGCYLATPNDENKKDIKGAGGMIRFQFNAEDLKMRSGDNGDDGEIEDPMKMMQKMQAETLKMKKMALNEKLLKKMLGDDDEKPEETVKENPMDNFMLMKMLSGEDKKSDVDLIKIMEMMENRNQRLIETLKDREPAKNEMVDFLKMMETRRAEEESRRREEEHRRDEERKERERREELERKERERRDEEQRKEERRRWEEQMKLDRERYEREAKEQRLRAEEEARLRREEMKLESEKNARRMQEERDYQFKMMDMMQGRRDGESKATAELMSQITKGAMGSMQMASTAAETIMSIARNSAPSQEKEEGIGDMLKGLASAAGPLLMSRAQAPAAPQLPREAIEGLQLLERVGGVDGLKRLISSKTNQAPKALPQKKEQTVQGTDTKPSMEATEMIAQFIKANTYVKDAIVGNISEKLGVQVFLPMLTEFDHPMVDSVLYTLVNIPAKKLQAIVLDSCETDEERAIIQGADKWFVDFKTALRDELFGDDDDEDEEEETEEEPEAETEEPETEVEEKAADEKPEVKGEKGAAADKSSAKK